MSTPTTTPPVLVKGLAAAVQTTLGARAEEQVQLDDLSIKLEALCADYLRVRGDGDAARLQLRTLLTQRAPGHTDLSNSYLLSDAALAESYAVETALRDAGLDVALALRPPVAPDILEAWRKNRGG